MVKSDYDLSSNRDLEIDLYSKETIEMIDFLKKEYHTAHTAGGINIKYELLLYRRDPMKPHCLIMAIHGTKHIYDIKYISFTLVSIDPKESKEQARIVIKKGTQEVVNAFDKKNQEKNQEKK
jgi:hypothetical protein